MKLMEGFDSNYRYILVAARRARQLQGGAPPVIDTHSRKPCRIAQDEIKAGKVKWMIPESQPRGRSPVEAAGAGEDARSGDGTRRNASPFQRRAVILCSLRQISALAQNRAKALFMKIALGVCGGIAAYKAAEIVRLLQDRGIRVQVIMTARRAGIHPAAHFRRSLRRKSHHQHVCADDAGANPTLIPPSNISPSRSRLTLWSSLLPPPMFSPKFAQGIANDFLTTLYLATTAPVVVAPAMNVNMWNHPATQTNLEILRSAGVHIVEPGAGYLACGMTGAGRLAENETIVAAIMEALGASQDLAGETVLITAGPTREKIDPVRYLTNRSSGRMGYALAEAALRRGARVFLVSGPTCAQPRPAQQN